MLVSKNAKICVTPNASQWNIGRIGSPTQNSRVGHASKSQIIAEHSPISSHRVTGDLFDAKNFKNAEDTRYLK